MKYCGVTSVKLLNNDFKLSKIFVNNSVTKIELKTTCVVCYFDE